MKINLVLILLCYNCLAFAQCSLDDLLIHKVRASQTDGRIAWEANRHYAFLNPSCNDNHTLLIHLVGSYDSPNKTLMFPSLAANNSYHVVSLVYPNSTAAKTACANSQDSDCYLKFRNEIIYGRDENDVVEVDEANSIMNRLVKLLEYLDTNFPEEGWDQFLKNHSVVWSKTILSGHSQGGGHVAAMAIENRVKRVIMFASPNDYSNYYSAPANWSMATFATPDSAFYGILNYNDDVVDFPEQFEFWKNLGMDQYGDSINIDQANYPYLHSHQLITYQNISGLGANHSLMIRDNRLPLDASDQAVIINAWKYLLGIHDQTSSSREKGINNAYFSLFPSPCSGLLHVELSSRITRPIMLLIYNEQGKLLMEKQVFDYKSVSIDMSPFSNGLYYLRSESKEGMYSSQFTLMK